MSGQKPFVLTDDDGLEVTIPTRFEVCERCEGRGTHVNPAIDGHGISREEMDEAGPEFFEDYMRGVYDVACERCGGLRVEEVPDWDMLTPKQQELLEQHQRMESEIAAERRAEERFGY